MTRPQKLAWTAVLVLLGAASAGLLAFAIHLIVVGDLAEQPDAGLPRFAIGLLLLPVSVIPFVAGLRVFREWRVRQRRRRVSQGRSSLER